MDSYRMNCRNVSGNCRIRTGTFAEASAGNGICANAEIRKGI